MAEHSGKQEKAVKKIKKAIRNAVEKGISSKTVSLSVAEGDSAVQFAARMSFHVVEPFHG